MRECWINVYIYNVMGYCWPTRNLAIGQYFPYDNLKPLYRIHVRYK